MDPDRTQEHLPDSRSQEEPGSSKAEVITMALFGVMVIVTSICLVIW